MDTSAFIVFEGGEGAGKSTQSGALADYLHARGHAVVRTRDALTRDLRSLGFEVLPSAANFVFACHPAHSGEALASALRARNILVRHFKLGRISNHLRITIGTDAQCTQLLIACREILK